MKKLFSLNWLYAFSALLLVSCGSSGNDLIDKVEAWPVKLEEKDNWSLIDRDGKIVYEDYFKECPSAIIEGYFSVKEKGGYVLYKADGKKPIPVKDCEGLVSVGVMSDDMIPVTKSGARITMIDGDGEQLFELAPIGKHEIVSCDYMYKEDMLWIRTDEKKYGFINRKGNVVIKPTYDKVGNFSEDLCIASKLDNNGESVNLVIDKEGEVVFKLKKGWEIVTREFKNGCFVVKDGERYIFVDKEGETQKCSKKVEGIEYYDQDIIIYWNDEKCGVMHREDEEIIIKPRYEYITRMEDGRYLCQGEDGKTDILNDDGDKEFTIDDYAKGVGYNKFFGMVGIEKNYNEVLDEDGKPIKDRDELYKIGNILTCYEVESDYVDLTALFKVIKRVASPKGIDKYVLGGNPQNFMSGSPEDYMYKYSVNIEDSEGDGIKYSVTGKFKNSLGSRKYITDYDSYGYYDGYHYEYQWADGNELEAIETTIYVQQELHESAFNKCVDEIKSLGYNLGASNYEYSEGKAIFRKGNIVLTFEMEHRYDDTTVIKVLSSNNVSDFEYSRAVSRINGDYDYVSSFDYDYSYTNDCTVVDSVAVTVPDFNYTTYYDPYSTIQSESYASPYDAYNASSNADDMYEQVQDLEWDDSDW